MTLSVHESGGVAFVQIPGEVLDAGNAKGFKKSMEPIVQQHHAIALDLRQLQFVDSSGLGAILTSLRKSADRGGDVRIFGLTKPVRALFELVRLHRIFQIFNDEAEVLKSYQVQRNSVS